MKKLKLLIKKGLIPFLIFLLFGLNSFAQTPANDNSWDLTWEDDFETTEIDDGLWRYPATDHWKKYFTQRYNDDLVCDTHELQAYRTFSNLICYSASSMVRIITKKENTGAIYNLIDACCCHDCCGKNWCDCLPPNPNCDSCKGKTKEYEYSTTPWLKSRMSFKYGFFQARLRLTNLTGNQNNLGHGANFWLYSPWKDVVSWSEIDILEFISHFGGQVTPHFHTLNTHFQPCDTCPKIDEGPLYMGTVSFPEDQYHTFAAAWTPNFIKFYRDDELIHVSKNNQKSMAAMQIIIDMNVFTGSEFPDNNTITGPIYQMDYNYDIDHVKVYELNTDYYNTDYSSCSISGLQPSLYKSISIGGAGCNPTVYNGENRTLRAINTITLNKGFTAELGCVLLLEFMEDHTQDKIPVPD